MNKKYNIQKVVNNRYAVWYMDTPKDRTKLGVWKIIDLYPGSRPTKFAFRWRVKGKEKTQEQLDEIILGNAIRYFNRKKIYRGNRYEKAEGADKVA